MKKLTYISVCAMLLLAGCSTQQQTPPTENIKTVGESCSEHAECQTPIEYLIQSNCPFAAACIDSTCQVICPLATDSDGKTAQCSKNSDCNCANRPNRLDCLCLDGQCVSVEAR